MPKIGQNLISAAHWDQDDAFATDGAHFWLEGGFGRQLAQDSLHCLRCESHLHQTRDKTRRRGRRPWLAHRRTTEVAVARSPVALATSRSRSVCCSATAVVESHAAPPTHGGRAPVVPPRRPSSPGTEEARLHWPVNNETRERARDVAHTTHTQLASRRWPEGADGPAASGGSG